MAKYTITDRMTCVCGKECDVVALDSKPEEELISYHLEPTTKGKQGKGWCAMSMITTIKGDPK